MTTPKRQIEISVCVGFILTILVTWALAVLNDVNMFDMTKKEPINNIAFPAYMPSRWKYAEERWTYTGAYFGYEQVGLTTVTKSVRGNPSVGAGLWYFRFGWPAVALQMVEITISDDPGMPAAPERAELERQFMAQAGWRMGVQLPMWMPLPSMTYGGPVPSLSQRGFHFTWTRNNPATLPLMPIWLGFLVDWAFYTPLAWLLLFLPGVVLRKRRFRRGQCLNCGYPLGAETCSECGHVHAARLIPSS